MGRELVILIALTASAANPAAAYDLSQHQWQHRLLFLVAPESVDPDLTAQRNEIALRRDAVLDRDLRVFQLLPESGFVEDSALPADAVAKLREQLNVAPDDRLVILIGKDGGEKRRAELRTDLQTIFQQIDAMPMRLDEMRVKTEAGIEHADVLLFDLP